MLEKVFQLIAAKVVIGFSSYIKVFENTTFLQVNEMLNIRKYWKSETWDPKVGLGTQKP